MKTSVRIGRLRLVEVHDLGEQQRAERVDGRPHLGPELAGQRQELDRVARAWKFQPSEVTAPDLRRSSGRPARRGRHVALDVGDEDRDAGLGQLAGQDLERLGLAGPVAPAISPWRLTMASAIWTRTSVASSPSRVGLPRMTGRLGQPVAGRHRVEERLVHVVFRTSRCGVAGRRIGSSAHPGSPRASREDGGAMNIDEVEGIGPVYEGSSTWPASRRPRRCLHRGATPAGREGRSEATGIDGEHILEWVNHVDLMRIDGVGSEYADLLEAAGVDSPAELAQRNAGQSGDDLPGGRCGPSGPASCGAPCPRPRSPAGSPKSKTLPTGRRALMAAPTWATSGVPDQVERAGPGHRRHHRHLARHRRQRRSSTRSSCRRSARP